MIGLLSALDFSDNRFFIKLLLGKVTLSNCGLAPPSSGSLVAHLHTQFDQEMMRQHGHGHMMMQPVQLRTS